MLAAYANKIHNVVFLTLLLITSNVEHYLKMLLTDISFRLTNRKWKQ